MICDIEGIQLESINSIISSAKEALESENPVEAIKIASSVSGHLESLESTTMEAREAIIEAEKAIQSVDGSLISKKERLNESKDALDSGNYSLAKGLATSIIRDIERMSESMQSVQRGLRQKKKLIERFPEGKSGDYWNNKLNQIEEKADSEQWIEASELLDSLSKELQSFEKSKSEALELYLFLESEWFNLRKNSSHLILKLTMK